MTESKLPLAEMDPQEKQEEQEPLDSFFQDTTTNDGAKTTEEQPPPQTTGDDSPSNGNNLLQQVQQGLVFWGSKVQAKIQEETQPDVLNKRKEQVHQGLQMLQSKIIEETQAENLNKRKDQLSQGISLVGSHLQNLNLAKLIDKMEQDESSISNQWSEISQHLKEDKEFRDIQKQAEVACLQVMQDNLKQFLLSHKERQYLPTYEQWIEHFHPENTHEGALISGLDKEVDFRFYIEESDHRRLWNAHPDIVGTIRVVQPRGRKGMDMVFGSENTNTTLQHSNNPPPVDFLSEKNDTVVVDDPFARVNPIVPSSATPPVQAATTAAPPTLQQLQETASAAQLGMTTTPSTTTATTSFDPFSVVENSATTSTTTKVAPTSGNNDLILF